jgi:TPR repeat protein
MARFAVLGCLVILGTSCKRRDEIKQEPPDAAPEPCIALNNEASALMLKGYVPDGGGRRLVPGAPRAVELYEQACPRCTVSCANLAKALLDGDGTTKNAARAVELYQGACDKGDLLACVSLGNQFALGFDVPSDEARAESLYGKACTAGDMSACSNLAGLMRRGDAGPTDPRVRALYEKSCAGGNTAACTNLGVLLEDTGATAAAKRLYAKACDAGSVDACLNAEYADSDSPTRLSTFANGVGFRRID